MAHDTDIERIPGAAEQPDEVRPHRFGLFVVYSRNTGNSFWVYWAPFFLAAGALLLGIPVYMAQRRHLTKPAPVPPYR